MHPLDFMFIFHGFLLFLVYGSSGSNQRRGLGAGVNQVVDFDCPEEFGYYPHPSDCTQYYVCVFGGALLESCTGGLMYSHELQTCDWPRNVGCGESGGSDGGTISTVRVTDPRTRAPQQQRTSSHPQHNIAQGQSSRNAQQQQQQEHRQYSRNRQPEVIEQTLYSEDLGPAEEIETDRQQRVYRGQPSTIGQVQRDRDGVRLYKGGNAQNVIPSGPGTQDKVSVVSFGSQRPSSPRPQEQYSNITRTADVVTDILDNSIDDSKKVLTRRKRQLTFRIGSYQSKKKIPIILIPSSIAPELSSKDFRVPTRSPNYGSYVKNIFRSAVDQPTSYTNQNENEYQIVHDTGYNRQPGSYQPHNLAFSPQQSFALYQSTKQESVQPYRNYKDRENDELLKLTQSTIQSDFRPISNPLQVAEHYTPVVHPQNHKIKYIETLINPLPTHTSHYEDLREPVRTPIINIQKIKIRNETRHRPESVKHQLQISQQDFFVPEITKKPTSEVYTTETTVKPTTRLRSEYHHKYRRPVTTESPREETEATGLTSYKLKPTKPTESSSSENRYRESIKVTAATKANINLNRNRDHSPSRTTENPYKKKVVKGPEIYDYTLNHRPNDYDYSEYDSKPKTKSKVKTSNATVGSYGDGKVEYRRPVLKDHAEVKNKQRHKNYGQTEEKEEPVHKDYDYGTNDDENKLTGYKPGSKEHDGDYHRPGSVDEYSYPETTIANKHEPFPYKSKYTNTSFGDYLEELRLETGDEIKIPSNIKNDIDGSNPVQNIKLDLRDQEFYVPDDNVVTTKKNKFRTSERPEVKLTTTLAPRKKIPEEYYENFKPFPTQPTSLTDERRQRPKHHYDDGDLRQQTIKTSGKIRVEELQNFQVTTPLPPLTPSQRHVERYNTSQRYQPNQYDQYYALYDEDTDLYRGDGGYNQQQQQQQQQYQTPSSTPSSNIAHQYRGQSTYKQQNVELEQPQQDHRNTYNQDVYSPSPVAQDYNDQFNIQVSDQQYQQPTPKSPSRSESSNSSKDALPQSSVTNPRITNNTTLKSDPVPITRRSDTFKPDFDPSSILVPPPQRPQFFDGNLDTSLTPPKNQKAYYLEQFPNFRSYFPVAPSRQNLEPPRNGGNLAKTLNNFDSILTSFFTAVTTEKPIEKSLAETIVRSEIGRIPHDPIVIGNNFEKPNEPTEASTSTTVMERKVGTEGPQSTAPQDFVPPSDYLTYFVEIEPKKPRQEFTTAKPERTTEAQKEEEKIVSKVRGDESDEVAFSIRGRSKPGNKLVRISPSEDSRKVKLFASLDIEPIVRDEISDKRVKSAENSENETVEETEDSREKAEPLPLRGDFEVRNRARAGAKDHARSRQPVRTHFEENFKAKDYPSSEEVSKEKDDSGPASFSRFRNRETVYKSRQESEIEEPKVIDNPDPYKFVLVQLEAKPEKQLSTPAPFSRNPENEERNRKETRTRSRFPLNPNGGSDGNIDRNRFHSYESNPIRNENEEAEEPEVPSTRGRVTESHFSRPAESESTPAPTIRIRTTSEVPVSEEPEVKRKPYRRVVKIHRNELRNQALNGRSKVKRIRKPSTQSPKLFSEDPEDKQFTKENELHSTFRPVVVGEPLDTSKNRTRFRFTVEDAKDFTLLPNGKLGLFVSTTEPYEGSDDVLPRGFERTNERPAQSDIQVPSTVPSTSEKPLILITTRQPSYLRNLTENENRATVKPYRGNFKPTESYKIRRPATVPTDRKVNFGPHLALRQPGGSSYNLGTSNEVTVNRGTPATSRGTRPTLKPSTSIVSKASEFVDVYRYPPRRPKNIYDTPTPDKSAAKCRRDVCLLPDCSCGGKDIPGAYNAEEIPQLVMLTFDDSVNDLNKGLYSDLFERGRVNPNGCPISATFYVSHEWTDYSQVQNLYANGHEIASHSITHSFGEQFSQKKWTREISGQREILAAYGGVRLEDIRGMRAPFLAIGGNKMFKMLYDSNFTYDSSMPIYENRPPSWPYTLDYKLFHDCMIPPCPTKSYPGVWEVPMVMWQDLNGGRCSMGDACSNPPTADGVYKMLIKNFERHFTTNRAPFGLYYHAAWFTHEHHKEGFIAFLDTIVNMPEVWLVTSWQALEWVRDPQPLSTVENFPPFQCNVEKAKKCNNPKVCNLWHKSGVRYMRTCQPCPDVYPWTGKTGVRNSRVDNEIIDE